MGDYTRRELVAAMAAAAAGFGAAGCASMAGDPAPSSGKRVVVIGGGWGGATAARYVRLADPSIEVVLLEPNREFVSCPFSNLVLSGVRTLGDLTFGYDGLRKQGVKVRHEMASAIEHDRKRVRIGDGYLTYERLIVSPGVDFQWDQVEGLAEARDSVLHAWKAGPQTLQLAAQLQAMPDGGTVVMTVPPVAYRCPPGPYERACQVAWYLKRNKPTSKLIVLDANPNIISKTVLFRAAFGQYPNLEYRASAKVIGVDPRAREVRTEFDRVKYDVVNLIPPQRAGEIAVQADLVGADKRWCEVNHVTYESLKAPGVHVIGDATTGLPVPKSGNVANNMGKICANAVVQLINGKPVTPMAPGNTCYSWVNDSEAIAVVNAYRIAEGKVVQIEQKLTPAKSAQWGQNAVGWAMSIWQDMGFAPKAFALALVTVLSWALLSLGATVEAGPLDAAGYNKAFTCSACHGFAGNSPSGAMPILAGVNPAYFKRQIQLFAAGKRPSPEMEPYAKMVLELGVDEIAQYFAAQTRVPTPARVDRAAADRGKAAAGACGRCHGADGRGDAARLVPSVAGQAPAYLKLQMQAFKDGKRNAGDPLVEEMRTVMKTLSDATIDDIVAYYSSVR